MTNEAEIEYRGDFDPGPVREMLGLNGSSPCIFSSAEQARLAGMLFRSGHITLDEVMSLGMKVESAWIQAARTRPRLNGSEVEVVLLNRNPKNPPLMFDTRVNSPIFRR